MPPAKKVKKSTPAKKEVIKKSSWASKKTKKIKVVPVEISSVPDTIEENTVTPVISLEENKNKWEEQKETHLSSEQIIWLVVAAVFFVWMGYDIYMITTHLSSITERIFNFGLHLLIFWFFFYAIYWVLIREK